MKKNVKVTNADAIRSMGNKELFVFLNSRGFCPYVDGCKRGDQGCSKCLREYLGREVKAVSAQKDSSCISHKFD